jgi:hypothetical protein
LRIAEKMAFMIVFDGLPFETINKFGFIQLLKEVGGPFYVPPSPDTVCYISLFSTRVEFSLKLSINFVDCEDN